MDRFPFYRVFVKKSFLRGCFILSFGVECVLILMLIVGESGTSPQSLSADEVDHYAQYSIFFPDKEDCHLSIDDVLAVCTIQDEKSIGGRQYRFYTSDVLPKYIYQCDNVREIMETDIGTLYIIYISFDAEEVIFTISNKGIIRKDIYTEETDTYYVLSELENYKILHYRTPSFTTPIIQVLAGSLGFVLVLILVASKVSSYKVRK